MSEDHELTRREFGKGFMAVGAVGLTGTGAGPMQQVAIPDDLQHTASEHGFVAAPVLFGGLDERPAPGDGFFDDKTGVYVYQTDGSGGGAGEKYWIAVEAGDIISGWNELPMPVPQTQVDEVRTEEFIAFLDHTFARPEAPDTKNWNFTDADITAVQPELQLASTTVLESEQRGNYAPGSEAVAGFAQRLDDAPTAGRGEAAYATADEGFGAGEDATDSYVFIRKDGSDHRVHRGDWSEYNPDSRVWVSQTPVITRFPHLWYGGGAIEVRAIMHEGASTTLRTLHRFTPDNVPESFHPGPPFDQSNLPIRFETSGLTGANFFANAAHYELGESAAETRVNGEHFEDVTVPADDWVPLMAWRKRNNWQMVNVKPFSVNVAASGANVKLELQIDPTFSAATWQLPTHTSSSETAVEVSLPGNTTIDTDGERRWIGSAAAGQGNSAGSVQSGDLTFNLPAAQPVVLAAQSTGGSATAEVGGISWEEFF